MKRKPIFDICMISLGLVVLVVHYGLEKSGYQGQRRAAIRQEQAAAMPPMAVYEKPKPMLTIPAGSPYQDLTPPVGQKTDPFLQVENIANGPSGFNLADKDADMRVLLDQHKGKDYYFILQQQAAQEMLRHGLFQQYYQDPTDKKVLHAIGFYVEQLQEAKSEDSKLIYMGLQALAGYWPKEKIASVAQSTVNRLALNQALANQDTTRAPAYYQMAYARELKKIGNRLSMAAHAE
ncbi:hypothetical protein [Rufibacter sp. LB8]|uniref:hypothetical protein n=1 Tax=Rufibacter sp. LB8 TaxID=2777781 RepID=UPI00178C3ACA|nr:hypothetical protein [Rufibacter sp. LB8]